jgi:hypothetical protein
MNKHFEPPFGMPKTRDEALAVLACWADPLTLTFNHLKAKRIHELLAPTPAEAAPVAVPAGMVLVPLEPTDAMVECAFVNDGSPPTQEDRVWVRDTYRLMLAAAPQAAAVAPDVQRDAERYRWLRDRDLETINTEGGVFAGKVPDNVVMNGDDLDQAIDEAMK